MLRLKRPSPIPAGMSSVSVARAAAQSFQLRLPRWGGGACLRACGTQGCLGGLATGAGAPKNAYFDPACGTGPAWSWRPYKLSNGYSRYRNNATGQCLTVTRGTNLGDGGEGPGAAAMPVDSQAVCPCVWDSFSTTVCAAGLAASLSMLGLIQSPIHPLPPPPPQPHPPHTPPPPSGYPRPRLVVATCNRTSAWDSGGDQQLFVERRGSATGAAAFRLSSAALHPAWAEVRDAGCSWHARRLQLASRPTCLAASASMRRFSADRAYRLDVWRRATNPAALADCPLAPVPQRLDTAGAGRCSSLGCQACCGCKQEAVSVVVL
jgi:hypothetical protein